MQELNRIKQDALEQLEQIAFYLNFVDRPRQHKVSKLTKSFESDDTEDMAMVSFINDYLSMVKTPLNYNATIISLYGCYEQYVDKLLLQYLKLYKNFCGDFINLPKTIKKNNILLASKFLENQNRYKRYNLTAETVVNNVYDGKLNYELMTLHAGNLSLTELQRVFNQVDINDLLVKIKNTKKFVKYFSDAKDLGFERSKKFINADKSNQVLNTITNLIDERNLVAHSWYSSERTSLEIIRNDWIPFLRTVFIAIFEIIITELFTVAIPNNHCKKMKNPEFYSSTLLGLHSLNTNLRQGDFLYLKHGKGSKLTCILSKEKHAEGETFKLEHTSFSKKDLYESEIFFF